MKTQSIFPIIALLLFSPLSRAEEIAVPGFHIEASGGLVQLESQLEGDGFAGKASSSGGAAYGGEVGYTSPEGLRLRLNYTHAESTFNPPETVTPDTVKAKRDEYSFSILTGVLGGYMESFRVGVGYILRNYMVDENSPVLMTTQNSQGLALVAEKDLFAGEKFFTTVRGRVYLPHSLSESPVSSGFNTRYLGYEGTIRLNWRVREDLSLFGAFIYGSDTAKFDGTGGRNTTSAKDTRTTMMVPVGLTFNF